MKKTLLILFLISSWLVKSQVPQGFSYQAVIKNASGSPMANQNVKVRINLTNSLGISTHYSEVHSKSTNSLGIISLIIGEGEQKLGTLEGVPWQNGDIYVKVEVDPTGTSGFQSLGDPVRFYSVPYAFYASNIKEVTSQTTATDDDPIFVVKNKAGQIVFAVYQNGVRVNVEDKPIIKGVRGGFAVGGLSQTKAGTIPEYFLITPDSARIYTNNNITKGARGGFAVGGLSQTKGSSSDYLQLTEDNSFIGLDAGKSNTTGIKNSFIGYKAGTSNSIGNNNVFIGDESGSQNLSGNYNVFIGPNSGMNNKTGVSNISIGQGAGQNLNKGMKNVFIGVSAGNMNADGIDNVFIGNFAGSQSIANSNVFIGRTSGYSNTTGTNNVFVGEQTGRFNTEGSGNVFLGDQAGMNEKGSNRLYIANNSTYAPLIYGEFDNGKVDVNGSISLKDILNIKPKYSYVGSPKEGDIFYDGNTHTIKYFNGSNWMELSATAITASTPLITTINVTLLTLLATSCTVNCNISSQGGSAITQSGIKYSTVPFFDSNSGIPVTTASPGVGDFSINLTGLLQKRTYYVRAFATNSQGTALGNMITFTTPLTAALPSVKSNPITNISQTTAVGGGNVSFPGGTTLSAVGLCYGTSPSPTIANNNLVAPVALGDFTFNLTGLSANTTYYVRAYATNSVGTNYGNEVVFTTASDVTTVLDIDGNTYNTVQIGTQTWMKENLKTTKYNDGSAIENVTDIAVWNSKTTGTYCWYNNNITNKDVYGALYNYYAVVDNRNLCPSGWHIPKNIEWLALSNYFGGEKIAGGKLKEIGTQYWNTPNTGADNSSGFTAQPGGQLYTIEGFTGKGDNAFFWSSTQYDTKYVYLMYLDAYSTSFVSTYDEKIQGFSVRCLKDN